MYITTYFYITSNRLRGHLKLMQFFFGYNDIFVMLTFSTYTKVFHSLHSMMGLVMATTDEIQLGLVKKHGKR